MTTPSTAKNNIAKWFIWLIPIASIVFAAYLVMQEYGNRGPLRGLLKNAF